MDYPLPQGHAWKKSSFSMANGACVEVAFVREIVYIRDSNGLSDATLTVTEEEWLTFIRIIKSGGELIS